MRNLTTTCVCVCVCVGLGAFAIFMVAMMSAREARVESEGRHNIATDFHFSLSGSVRVLCMALSAVEFRSDALFLV